MAQVQFPLQGTVNPIRVPSITQPDIGNIIRTIDSLKTSAETRKAAGAQRNLAEARLTEFQETASVRRETEQNVLSQQRQGLEQGSVNLEKSQAELEEWKSNAEARREQIKESGDARELDLETRKLELQQKRMSSMKDELAGLSVDQYPAFLEKWSKAGADISRFPTPDQIGNDPKKFRAMQRQLIQGAQAFNNEIEREKERIQAQKIEGIKQKGATERSKIYSQTTDTPKLTGDMANFYHIHDRKPNSPAEFKKFKQSIKDDTGLSKEQKELKNDYFKAIGRANSAAQGVGQFVPDPNKDVVAKAEYARAEEIKEAFIESGGDPSRLGISNEEPKTEETSKTLPPEARKMLKEGRITTFENGQKWTLNGGVPRRVN